VRLLFNTNNFNRGFYLANNEVKSYSGHIIPKQDHTVGVSSVSESSVSSESQVEVGRCPQKLGGILKQSSSAKLGNEEATDRNRG
jgi:hypothetical protein